MLHYWHFLTDLPARAAPAPANLADYGFERPTHSAAQGFRSSICRSPAISEVPLVT